MNTQSIIITIEENDTSAEAVVRVINHLRVAQNTDPTANRHLTIKVNGHRNTNGGLERDMFRFMTRFLLAGIGEQVTVLRTPIYTFTNPHAQKEFSEFVMMRNAS